MRPDQVGAALRIGERVRDRHLTTHRRIVGLELDDLHHLVRDEAHEAAVERVGVLVTAQPVAGSVRREISNVPPSCGSNTWIPLVIPSGTIH